MDKSTLYEEPSAADRKHKIWPINGYITVQTKVLNFFNCMSTTIRLLTTVIGWIVSQNSFHSIHFIV